MLPVPYRLAQHRLLSSELPPRVRTRTINVDFLIGPLPGLSTVLSALIPLIGPAAVST